MWSWVVIVFLVAFGTGMAPVVQSAIPVPQVPKAHGKQCVAEPAFMRRNHMELLFHRRDEVMQRGSRQASHRFDRCLTCHAVLDVNQQPVTHESDKHFCNVCHQYVTIKIDCFDCHNSTPSRLPYSIKQGIHSQ